MLNNIFLMCPSFQPAVENITQKRHKNPTLERHTAGERVSHVTNLTGANRIVIHDGASGVGAARSRARVAAAVAGAGKSGGALGVDGALRPAVGRAGHVVGQARTSWTVSTHHTLGVGAARRWNARVAQVFFGCNSCYWKKSNDNLWVGKMD